MLMVMMLIRLARILENLICAKLRPLVIDVLSDLKSADPHYIQVVGSFTFSKQESTSFRCDCLELAHDFPNFGIR